MNEEDFRDDKKVLEAINGDSMIIWLPDMGYAVEDTMETATTAILGGLYGVD